jgi:molybdopterin-guanine dinucleotide biosynthesis protein B
MHIAISGFSGSGKTEFITHLIDRLIGSYTVLVIKETQQGRVDIMGKDSHRHCEAGATACALIAEKDTALFFAARQEVDDLISLIAADVVFLEGFKQSPYPKIWLGEGDGPNVVLRDPSLEAAETYVREQILMEQLGGLDCGNCGYPSCPDLAREIVGGQASLEACEVLGTTSVTVKVDGQPIPLNTFVEKFIAGTIRGMLSSLHRVDASSDAYISITIDPPDNSLLP